jgi:NAD+ synthase (glutamine-hydrolysing)
MRTFRLAMAQINVTVGDLEGNTAKIISYIDRARALKADLVAFPELAVTGYPPEDLVLKPQFVRDNVDCIRRIVESSDDIATVFGFLDGDSNAGPPQTDDFAPIMPRAYNAAGVASGLQLVGVYHKVRLPNYGVFDEDRYFKPGDRCPVYIVNGTSIGVNICEDIWYPDGPMTTQSRAGAEVVVNINGSPFHTGKGTERQSMLSRRAADNGVFVAYVNMVGGQDELVFDGGSMVFDPSGEPIVQGSQFEEELIVVDLEVEAAFPGGRASPSSTPPGSEVTMVSSYTASAERPPLPRTQPTTYDGVGEVYAALVLGTRDYVRKCGFDKVLIALSGGIDSSLVAAIAADALGADNVVGVAMPSRFSSEGSVLDARALADSLGVELREVPIEESFSAFLDTLGPHFEGTEWGVAEENLQSRVRGNLIMALSNKFGWLVLTTGNKSEMATGYATIYGDMAGGFAVIKDVPKLLVYELARHRNSLGPAPVIPRTVLEKPPSAELRADQKDEDSLPPYSVLDPILKAYVEEDRSFDEIVAAGFDSDVVKQVVTLVDRSEYKRRQAPPGIKITPRNFGRDRRMPIANRYRPF